MVCVNDPASATRIAHLVKAEFPSARLLVRAYDRRHSIELRKAGVDVEMRETFESAIAFGEAGLRELGLTGLEAATVATDIRRRDAERIEAQVLEGIMGGRDLMHSAPVPEPLIPVQTRWHLQTRAPRLSRTRAAASHCHEGFSGPLLIPVCVRRACGLRHWRAARRR